MKVIANNNYYIVTGVARGIGKALLDLLIKENKKIIAIARNRKNIEKRYLKLKNVTFFYGDVSNQIFIKKIFKFIKENKIQIKYLVNNAGQRQRKSFLKITYEDLKNIFEVNFFSIFNITQHFVSYVKSKPYESSVVNVSSIVGPLGFEQLSGYGATKAALNGFTKCLSTEFKGKIRFNSINPGFTKTSFYNKFKKNKKKIYNWTLSRTPMRRWANPNEIAELIYFLCSDKSSYINGETINIDGGWSSS